MPIEPSQYFGEGSDRGIHRRGVNGYVDGNLAMGNGTGTKNSIELRDRVGPAADRTQRGPIDTSQGHARQKQG